MAATLNLSHFRIVSQGRFWPTLFFLNVHVSERWNPSRNLLFHFCWTSLNICRLLTGLLGYSRVYKKILRSAESNYYREIFDTYKNNAKSIWKQINNICSVSRNKKSDATYIKKLTVNGNTVVQPDFIAEEMNSYFCNVGSNLAKKNFRLPLQTLQVI